MGAASTLVLGFWEFFFWFGQGGRREVLLRVLFGDCVFFSRREIVWLIKRGVNDYDRAW